MNDKEFLKKRSSFLLYFLVIGVLSLPCAQSESIIDSLQTQLQKARTKEDSIFALCKLCWKIGSSDPKSALLYGMKALELSEGTQNKKRLAEAYDAAAMGYWVNGNTDKAKELYIKALRVAEQNNISNRIAWCNYNLSNLSLQLGNMLEAKEYALKSRTEFQKLDKIDQVIDRDMVLVKTNGGGKNAFVDTTISDLKRAINRTTDSEKLLNYYIQSMYFFEQQENRTQSMLYAMKAIEIAEKINNRNAIVTVYYQIGDYLRDYQHNYETALQYYQKALSICKEDKIDGGIISVLDEIGTVHKLMGNDSLAFSCYNQSLEIGERIKHRHSQSNAYKNIGELYYQEKQYKNALSCLLKSYEIGCDKCPPIAFHSVLVDVGNVYLNAKDYKNALRYFIKSLSIADSVHAQYDLAVSNSALADLYTATNNPELALKTLSVAFDEAVSAHSLSLQKEISSKLSQAYRKSNNFRKALEYLDLSKSIADSLKTINDADNLSRLETKFEFQNLNTQKELELKESQIRAEAEISTQRQLKYFFIFAFIFMAAFGVVIYRSLRRKKKDSAILEEQKKQIEEMSEKVHEADQKKLNFFSNISHELRTPLTLILGPIEKLVKDHSSNQGALPLFQIIQRNTLQLYNLINQLLDIRKLDTGDMKLRVTEGDIANYCKGICSTFSHLAEANEIRFTFTSSTDNIIGWYNRDIVEKVLNNLLSNAFKYTLKFGEINVNLSPVSTAGGDISEVKIVVRDNGKGIPDDQVQYVFDRYYQVENANTGFNTGTGIGLAYAKELVELHKGKLGVESEINRGTTFTIMLPVHESYFSTEEKSQFVEQEKETETEDIRRKYLEQIVADRSEELIEDDLETAQESSPVMLVVEDNADLRAFIKNIFSDQYNIYEAEDGTRGYQLAMEFVPDIIISDIMMPGMNGLELCRKLKTTLQTSHIPILILTAKTGDENEITGLQTGADDYLTKPFNSEILQARINRLIESKKKLREYFTREFLLNPKEIVVTSPEDEFLKKAVHIVEENICNPNLNIEMLMKELAVSRTQLFRKLKAITNYSANQFIRNIKLKKAAQLLRQNTHNITEVLYLSGFNSPSYFAARFKEVYGCLPKDYSLNSSDVSQSIGK